MKTEHCGFGVSEDTGGMARRDFLKLGGAGLAGISLIGGFAASERAFAQSGDSGSLRREFEEAAREYNVPVQTLIAMGYVNTRWEMPDPGSTAYEEGEAEGKGTYGLMALVQNPTTDTLADAAALTGISESELKADRASNIRGGAALLAEASGTISGAVTDFQEEISTATDALDATGQGSVEDFGSSISGAADDLQRSLEAVSKGTAGGSAVAGVGGGELYAAQVQEALASGVPDSL